MSDTIQPLRHHDVPPESIPTGEQLLDRSTLPYLVWVPTTRAIVLGNSQAPEKELHVDAVQRDGIPVFKRMSGGGAVLLSPGCVCLSLRFAKDKGVSIQEFFAKGSGLVADVAREKLGLHLVARGTSDLAYLGAYSHGAHAAAVRPPEAESDPSRSGRKVAGCALYMPRDFVLYLVSILVQPDLAEISKYLAYPSKHPEYRAGRSHADFLAGLGALSGKNLQPSEFAGWLEQRLKQETPAEPGLHLDWELCPGV